MDDGLSLNLDFDFGNAELDFDLGDFDIDDGDGIADLMPSEARYWKPRIQKKSILRHVAFCNASEFARNIELARDARTYCWLDGGFIFGDIVEALCAERCICPKTIWITSLSLSSANVESLKNVFDFCGQPEINMILSAYFYSHEKFGIVRELYDKLDAGNKFQLGFTNVHSKVIAIETSLGNHIVIHGSANMRSSQSIEQVMVECDDDLYNFNVDVFSELMEKCKTINKRFGGKTSWRAVQQALEGERARAAQEQPSSVEIRSNGGAE